MSRPIGSKNIKWDREIIYDLYHNQGLNSNEVGKKLGTTGSAVRVAMYKLGIPTRSISEATKGERHIEEKYCEIAAKLCMARWEIPQYQWIYDDESR